MDKKILWKIMLSTKKGDFSTAINTLNGAIDNLDNDASVKITTCCYVVCTGDLKNEISINELLQLLMLSGSVLENLNERLSKQYLQSMYYILKFLSDKGDVGSIISLENMLIPNFINFQNENVRHLCSSMNKLIYNTVVKLYTSHDKQTADLSILSIKLLHKITPIDELLQGKVYDYFRIYSQLSVKCSTQYKCFLTVLNLQNKTKIKNNLKSIVNLLIVIIESVFKDNDSDLLICILNDIINVFININIDANLITFVEQFTSLVKEDSAGNELLIKSLSICVQILQSHPKSDSNLQAICMLACSIFSNLVKIHKDFNSDFTKYKLDPDVQIILHKLFKIIGRVFSNYTDNVQKDHITAINCTILSGYILKDCLTANVVVLPEECLREAGKCIEKCCLYVNDLKRTNSNWNLLWKEVGTMLYNLNIYLHNHKSKFYTFCMKLLIRNCISIEGIDGNIIKDNVLHSCLLNLTDYFFNKNEFKNALIISALNVSLFPDMRKDPFKQWIRIKIASHDSKVKEDKLLQQYNLPSILKKYQTYVKSIYVDFVLKGVEDLLLFEIKQYKAIWPNRVSLMSACKELFTISNTITTTKTLIMAWGDSVTSIPDDMKDILTETLEKLELETNNSIENPEKNICLGYLYYIKYNMSLSYERSKYLEMPKGNHMSDDECDIVCSYDCLKLNMFAEIMKYLNKSLHIFQKHINIATLDVLKNMNIYSLLIKIANEYRLYCYTLEYLQMLLLCLKLARMLNDNLLIVECAGFITENGKIDSVFIKELIKDIEKISIMENDNSDRKWKSLTSYYICLGSAYLKAGDVNTSLTHYQMAVTFYKRINEDDKLLKVRLDFLNWQHMLLPCNFEIQGHNQGFLVKPHVIVDNISTLFTKDGKHCSFITSLLFEMYEALVHHYLWLRLPREVRCYSKEVTMLAQQLVVPYRVGIFLVYLAEVDSMCCRFDDCKVKINGIRDILCLVRQHKNQILTEESAKDNMFSINSLTNEFQVMMLDCPDSDRRYNVNLESPTFIKDSFSLPKFINHDGDCHCFQCMSIFYKQLVLMEIKMQAELNFKSSQEYYKGALYVYKQIVLKQDKFNEKVRDKLNCDIFPDAADLLLEIRCSILLNFAKTLNGEERKTILEELTKLLKIKYVNLHLYNEACMLLEYLECPVKLASKSQNRSPILVPSVQKASVTPENRVSKININVSTRIPAKPRRIVTKNLKFDLSGSDSEDKLDKKSPAAKKEYAFAFPHSPTKTPAPSFKIFDQTSTKLSRKKKTEKNLVSATLPETPTDEKCSKMGIHLRSRTKLLTEKVKSSTKEKPMKDVPKIVVSNENNDVVDVNSGQRTIRRNLMNDMITSTSTSTANLQENDTNKNKGAIRKNRTIRK